jgi:hypothetical protein
MIEPLYADEIQRRDWHVPDSRGRAPTLEDYEGSWDEVFGIEKDDTFLDVDALCEEGVYYGDGGQGCLPTGV